MSIKKNIGITENYTIPKIRRIQRNKTFLYKYLNNVDESFFYFFFQRVNMGDLLFENNYHNFMIKNKLLKLLYVNKLFSYQNLTLNNISVIFIKRDNINPSSLFQFLQSLINNNNIVFLGGFFNDKFNKNVLIDSFRFSLLNDLFKNTKLLTLSEFVDNFNFNFFINIYQQQIIKKMKLITLYKEKCSI